MRPTLGIAGRIPGMEILLAGTVVYIVGLVVLKSALVRIGRLPARFRPDSSSHLMVHAPLEKCLAVLFAASVVAGLTAGIYRAWQIDSAGAACLFVALAVPLGWMAFLNLLKQRNTIELTDSAISWRRGSMVTIIKWTEVSGFAEAPSSTAWLVRSRDGRTLRVDKLLVGVPTTFVEYLRKHLSESLFNTALAYVRPMLALRLRIEKRSGLN
jgi:hypothetical protein